MVWAKAWGKAGVWLQKGKVGIGVRERQVGIWPRREVPHSSSSYLTENFLAGLTPLPQEDR